MIGGVTPYGESAVGLGGKGDVQHEQLKTVCRLDWD